MPSELCRSARGSPLSRGLRQHWLEAAAAGLKQIRETEMIGDDGVEDLTVDIKTITTHKIPLFKLKAWLESSRPRSTRGGSENEVAVR
jgi:hypothetical protein